ncbi:MAG: hypothetical protein ACI9XB_005399 [Gammaproteobacteria bacterium]
MKKHIANHGHLHNTSSGEDLYEQGGLELRETTINQQEKIEEIFLHLINLKKEADKLQKEIELAAVENKFLKEEVKEQEK